ncbi:hypothetical protein WOLCODRAFT_138802 [Wolfiporia cocos MD-104 SS10]|uniref:DUF1275 domain protein n=1 Tax=Wolfiporia cocos (strain MD-104) TaxID=742152 RepID=A0A2H3JZ31_WOLCO|nr:hypothetical protein WOLCODRAFT_138802 [Wolfiporia cocos MD-104 SS10]
MAAAFAAQPSAPPATTTATTYSPPSSALLLLCVSTGLIDSLTFAISGVWCAFVTGTTVQLGMDIPSLLACLSSTQLDYAALVHFASTPASERLAALTGFLFGGYAGSRLPSWVTPAGSSLLQATLLAGASALVLFPTGIPVHLPYPHSTLGLVSSSMALQAVLVQRFATPYATSVAWTSVWLNAVATGKRRWQKFVGISAVVGGAIAGAAIMHFGKDGKDDKKHGDTLRNENSAEREDKEKAELVRRVGIGLAIAAALKVGIAGIFWRRGRVVPRSS